MCVVLIFELLFVVVLTLVNGVLAMSELAIVSAKPARLKALAQRGTTGAATALELAADSSRFLSSVQVGITLIGVLSGAFSGATLGLRLATWLEAHGLSFYLAEFLGVGAVVVTITYASIIFGELVPKQLALANPEAVAARAAPSMKVLARVAAPLVWLLDVSGKAVLKLLGRGGVGRQEVTEEEVRSVIEEATTAGVLKHDERSMIAGVMRLADRSARGLMTPRLDVELLDLRESDGALRQKLLRTTHTRLPVRGEGDDDIAGVVMVRSVIEAVARGEPLELHRHTQRAPTVLDRTGALEVLRVLRASTVPLALVFDEYGHFEGLITASDVLEAITGVFKEAGDDEPQLVQRRDGSWLVAGAMHVDEFNDSLGASLPRGPGFETIAGFVLSLTGELPAIGAVFETGDWRIEVVDLDGRRVDRLLMTRRAER